MIGEFSAEALPQLCQDIAQSRPLSHLQRHRALLGQDGENAEEPDVYSHGRRFR